MDQKEKLKQMKYAMNARMFLIAAGLFLIFTAVTSTGQDGLRWFGIAKVVTDYDRDVAEGKITPPPAEEETKETVSEEKTENTAETDAESEEMKSETDAGSAEVKAEAEDESGTADTDSSNKEEVAETEAAAETASENAETTGTTATEEAAQEIDVPALKRDMATLGISVGDLKFLGIACFVIAVIRIFVGVICVKFSNRVDRSSITLKAVIGLAIAEVLYAAVMFLKKALFIGSLIYTFLIVGALLWGALRLRKLAKENPERVYAVEAAQRFTPQPKPAQKKSLREKAMMSTDIESLPEASETPEAPETSEALETSETPDTSNDEGGLS